jgi:hypothetical protein
MTTKPSFGGALHVHYGILRYLSRRTKANVKLWLDLAEHGLINMGSGVLVACRLMPELAAQIRVLAMHDDEFVELCDDLAEAQRALEGVTLLPEVLRKHRLAECEGWIVSLCAEIRAALGRMSLARPPRRP